MNNIFYTMKDIEFKKTTAYNNIREFIFRVNNSIKSEEQKDPEIPDPYIGKINEIVESTDLSPEHSRYANIAMKTVIHQIEELSDNRHLQKSFGESSRMDFGTGHELNFICYLYERCTQGLLKINEIYSLYRAYYSIIKKYIKKYNIEAAGARGCWSVDDYTLIPYIFGSAENFDVEGVALNMPNGLFKDACEDKPITGMLESLCKNTWAGVNVKMLSMYDTEVLGKYVVTQHFIYSSYLPCDF